MLRCPSHPHPAPPEGGGIGITLQNKARIPPTQVSMMLFSPLAGIEMKPPALGHWEWHPFSSALVYILRILLYGAIKLYLNVFTS